MFTEANTVESMIRDLLCGTTTFADRVTESPEPYIAGRASHGLG